MVAAGPDRLALGLIAAPLIAAATFVAVYPYLWPNPVAHTARMFAFRADSFDAQARNISAAAVPNRTDAFRRVREELGDHYSVAAASAKWLERVAGIDVELRAGLGGIDLALAIIGAELLAASVVRRGLRSASAMVALILGGQAALIVLTMGVAYPRYLFPVLLLETVCIGMLAGTIWSLLIGWFRRTSRVRPRLAPDPLS
jgi:hypothetical protein